MLTPGFISNICTKLDKFLISAYYSGSYMFISKNWGCFNLIYLGDMPHPVGAYPPMCFFSGFAELSGFLGLLGRLGSLSSLGCLGPLGVKALCCKPLSIKGLQRVAPADGFFEACLVQRERFSN